MTALAGAAILVYAIDGGEDFTDRATSPNRIDVALGVIFIVLLLDGLVYAWKRGLLRWV